MSKKVKKQESNLKSHKENDSFINKVSDKIENIEEYIEDEIQEVVEKKSFWFAERILFLANLVVFFVCALVLMITEAGNDKNGQFNNFIECVFKIGTLHFINQIYIISINL